MTGAERDPQTSVTMTVSVTVRLSALSLSCGIAARLPNWPSRLGDSFVEAKREREKERRATWANQGGTQPHKHITVSQFTAQKEKQA